MTPDDLMGFMVEVFPQVHKDFNVEAVTEDGVRMRLYVTEANLRPGGTVSGPSMFALADVAIYLATLSRIGPEALAVTTNGSIDFMRKPSANTDLIAEARLLKLGKTLSVGDVLIYSEGVDAPVARATLTYSIPPKRG
ncbi:Phenylacetic acid degradation-related protein [Candidatus Rhodobacter oscarellae]|uniref:Phenylacetic acid degradation-related protein n=2 Tax=Candidatus Rhodobacter oscarellae TaxID=1675527 RepID=A0A0J9E420_9RHOB|nr:Phenylacetic acid degradation-related protein [Candidatus Rhodobacter lobularis]